MYKPSFSLAGKTAIVTGGKRGIGKAIALTFAEAGADVAICSRTDDGELSAVAQEIKNLGRRSLAIPADVSRKSDVDNLVERVAAELGAIDILVNNAGNLIKSPLMKLSEEDWDSTIDTHLKGSYLCCQAAGRKMIERKRGNIINFSSGWAIAPAPEGTAYCVAKTGIITMTRCLARELGKYSIRVNAIAPGMTKTKMIDYVLNDPAAIKQEEAKIPLGRLGEPSDVANLALFLASDASCYLTGHVYFVDGGKRA